MRSVLAALAIVIGLLFTFAPKGDDLPRREREALFRRYQQKKND